MSYPVPRSHYLYVHDGLRRLFGKENVELSAFVQQKKPFQCDMLLNSPATDPEVLGQDPDQLQDLLRRMQEVLGNCSLRANGQRIDIVFRDDNTLQLALGAPKAWLNNLSRPEDINAEPDWRKRNRLRISLGFDEALFTSTCSLGMNLAARSLEKSCYDYYKRSPLLSVLPGNLLEQFHADYHNVTPPVTYWQAHCYALAQAYPIRHFEELERTVWRNFSLYFEKYPFDNPYCAGEDLNTMACAQLLCSIWQQTPISSSEDVVEAVMDVRGDGDGEEAQAGAADAEGSGGGFWGRWRRKPLS